MPLLRRPARPLRARLPPRQRVPALTQQPLPPAEDPAEADAVLDVLARGEVEVVGRIVGASNATLVVTAALEGRVLRGVYKPVAGEQPLWDFPDGTLAGREVAAHVVSAAAGWGVVPPTVLRDGPLGPGSVQLWVGDDGADAQDLAAAALAAEPGAGLVDVVPPRRVPPGWHVVVEGSGGRGEAVVLAHADDPGLARMAAFDAVVNNADRKGGHVLRGGGGRVWGVDHGLTFHTDPKLRTVLWGWAGERLPRHVTACLEATVRALSGDLAEELVGLVSEVEVVALAERAERLLARGRYPKPRPGSHALPWPPF